MNKLWTFAALPFCSHTNNQSVNKNLIIFYLIQMERILDKDYRFFVKPLYNYPLYKDYDSF